MVRTPINQKKKKLRVGRIVFALSIVAVGVGAFVWREKLVSLVSGKPTLKMGALVSKTPVTIPPDYLEPGRRVCSRDLAYLATWVDRLLADKPRKDREALENLRDIALETKKRFPQVIWFKVEKNGDALVLVPDDWKPDPVVKRRTSADIVIVGGELSSLATAVEAAERKFSVVVVYAGPLGGLSSDRGGNLRFFDVMKQTTHPIGQRKIWKSFKALGFCALPVAIDQSVHDYIKENYAGRIELIETSSYDSLVADCSGDELNSITTKEGVVVSGRRYIDMDPESRLAEKCGIPMNTDTQHLSYGLVFTIEGIRDIDWIRLDDAQYVTPERISEFAGVSLANVKGHSIAENSLIRLRKFVKSNPLIHGKQYSFGYSALAQGFDFYMQLRGIERSEDKELRWINTHRSASGFNIAMLPGATVFNSMSYKLKKSILQHSHDLFNDEEFVSVRRYDVPSLERFFRWVSGNPSLRIRPPKQFYVRSASAFFETLHPYDRSEFNNPPKTEFHTYYPMDLRDLNPRDPYSWEIVMGMVKKAKFCHFWDNRPSATYTRVKNLYLVNKSAVTPVFFGGQRIEGNQINMGAALIHSF